VVDLGGFYLDILKDRLYTLPEGSHARRSAQTALWHITEAMVRWLAPILSFTAEEMWRFIPGTRAESVFLSTWYQLPELPADAIDWPWLISLRADVARELERLRAAGTIGAPLEAEVDIYCTAEPLARLAPLGAELRFLLITSAARTHLVDEPPPEAVAASGVAGGGVWLTVQPTKAIKCERCWQHTTDVGSHREHPTLCVRCVTNLSLPGENRRMV